MRHNGILLRRAALTPGGTIRVSMQVANLEADLGLELLSRAGRNPVLVGSWCHMTHGIGWAFVSDHVIAASPTAPDRQARPAIRRWRLARGAGAGLVQAATLRPRRDLAAPSRQLGSAARSEQPEEIKDGFDAECHALSGTQCRVRP